jgi:hypothetical protein
MQNNELDDFEKTLHFNRHDMPDLCAIIQRRRPRWDYGAIVAELKIAALRMATLGQVMSAAEKAMNNPKCLTPKAINFPENWEQTQAKTAGNIAAPRVCMECTQRFPADQVTKHPSGHGFICGNHEETV